MLRWDILEIRWSLFDIRHHQWRILLLQWVCVEIVRNTKCVFALCVCSGRGTVGPLRSTTFFHIVIENKCTWPLCGLWREVRSNSITRIRCDPTQHFNHVMISVYGRFKAGLIWADVVMPCYCLESCWDLSVFHKHITRRQAGEHLILITATN